MKKKRLTAAVFFLSMVMCFLFGCGGEEYAVEYGVEGYVYLPGAIWTEKGISSAAAEGEYLYFARDTEDATNLERISLAQLALGEVEDFSDSIVLVRIQKEAIGLPNKKMEETNFLDLLEGKHDASELQCLLRLGDYVADRNQNLYYYIEIVVADEYSMEYCGGVVCRQTAEDGRVYATYLSQISDIAADKEGRAYAMADDGIWVLDQEGGVLGRIPTEGYRKEGEFAVQELFTDAEGRVYYRTRDARGVSNTYEAEWSEMPSLQECRDFPGEYACRSACPDGKFLLYNKDSGNALYEYDRKGGIRQVLRWPDSGLMSMNIDWVVRAAPEVLLAGCGNEIYQLNRTSVEELPERELLVIASANGGSYELQKAVMEFNVQSDLYRIAIDDYGAYYSEQDEGWVCPRLDAALVSSASPDLLDLQMLNIYKYADKGVLEDLSPYLEKSILLDDADYLDNIIEGMNIGGSLVCIPRSFQIHGVALRRAQAGETDSWTMEDLYRLTENVQGTKSGLVNDGYGGWKQRDYLLEELCSAYYLDRFVDWENRKCDFQQEEFKKLLTWVRKYGGTGTADKTDEGWRQYVPDEALLVSLDELDFLSLFYLEVQCGEEVALCGFPAADGRGRFRATGRDAMAITSGSRHKDAAWEFMEYFLSSQNGSEFSAMMLSTSKSELYHRYEEAVAPKYAEGSDIMTAKSIRYVVDQWVPYYMTPKEQADMILQAIETADFTPLTEEEETVIRIVTEEAESYFTGGKSLEEVTEVIQNRVQLLLQEG